MPRLFDNLDEAMSDVVKLFGPVTLEITRSEIKVKEGSIGMKGMKSLSKKYHVMLLNGCFSITPFEIQSDSD